MISLGSMGLVYLPTNLPSKSRIHVGKIHLSHASNDDMILECEIPALTTGSTQDCYRHFLVTRDPQLNLLKMPESRDDLLRCFQPIWKICSSNWIIIPGRAESRWWSGLVDCGDLMLVTTRMRMTFDEEYPGCWKHRDQIELQYYYINCGTPD